MSDLILCATDGPIATVTLNRPEKLNALTKPMWQQLGDTLRELSQDDTLRCVVLRGAGGQSFSPGNDIGEFETERSNFEQAKAYGVVLRDALGAISGCQHPTVALIEGICVGGGLEIAACCDLRICSEGSRFGVPIKRLGLVLAHAEMAALLRLAGPAVTMELLLEGRIYTAAEALAKGLVTRMVADADVVAEAMATAKRIAEGAPLVARWHKRFLRDLEAGQPLSEADRDEGYRCYDTEDFGIGYRAFLAKTTPNFVGR
ncbi:MAG: enoyl-CoA hydratase-related protein [Rubrivivax sp.]